MYIRFADLISELDHGMKLFFKTQVKIELDPILTCFNVPLDILERRQVAALCPL